MYLQTFAGQDTELSQLLSENQFSLHACLARHTLPSLQHWMTANLFVLSINPGFCVPVYMGGSFITLQRQTDVFEQ